MRPFRCRFGRLKCNVVGHLRKQPSSSTKTICQASFSPSTSKSCQLPVSNSRARVGRRGARQRSRTCGRSSGDIQRTILSSSTQHGYERMNNGRLQSPYLCKGHVPAQGFSPFCRLPVQAVVVTSVCFVRSEGVDIHALGEKQR